MKNLMILMAITLIVGFLCLRGQALAEPADGINLNWGHELTASETACPPGNLVLKVVRKVVNSLDSGTGTSDNGNVYWATLDYVQHIQVVETSPNNFCATLKTQGSFESIGGDGPGCRNEVTCGEDVGRLEAGVVGTMQGGATLTFEGTFSPGNMRTRGSIGTFDNDCYPVNGACNGSGFRGWVDDYFIEVPGFTYEWWGWVYHAGNNGSWVNQANGNEGNIIGD